jgi:F-type H+-transporting ATPase subunit delta
MTLKQTAKQYNTALYTIAEESGTLNEVFRALMFIDQLARTESQFRSFLQSKRITGEQKTSILNTILGDHGHPLVNELLSHLKGTQATKILRFVANLFDHQFKEGKNIVSVEGVVSGEFDERQVSSLKSSLDDILGKETDLTLNVDQSLLGGIRLRIGNTLLDASIQNQLQMLRAELMHA